MKVSPFRVTQKAALRANGAAAVTRANTSRAAATIYRYDVNTRTLHPVKVDPARKPSHDELPLGATVWGKGTAFLLWAPKAKQVELVVRGKQSVPMTPVGNGYVTAYVDTVGAGTRYGYRLDGGDAVFPDPVSHFQPDGEHGLSQVIDHSAFRWGEGSWRGRPLNKMNITEVHIGTLTPTGTFDSARGTVKRMAANTVELMPLHQFPGERNWGYDPAQLSAVQHTYGTPDQFKGLVNAAHRAGKAVVVDVVHNHPGPLGAYAGAYAPYFDNGGKTPWGNGVSVEGPAGRDIARYFIENTALWLGTYRADGLRFDATVFLPDALLQETSQAVRALGAQLKRPLSLISENNRNNRRVVEPVDLGGHGFDGQWSMDLQYALRSLLPGESGWRIDRYTANAFKWVATSVAKGWGYEGQRSSYERENHHFGTPAKGLRPESFVVAKDDHDQIGNTPEGARFGNRIGPRLDRAVDALYGAMPFTLMNFQGDDHRSPKPFDFFVDMPEPLATDIREGRNREWVEWLKGKSFRDPNDRATFEGNKLDPADRKTTEGRQALALSQQISRLRQSHPAMRRRSSAEYEVVGFAGNTSLMQRRWNSDSRREVIALTNLSDAPVTLDLVAGGVLEETGHGPAQRRTLDGTWRVLLSTEEKRFGGSGGGLGRGASVNVTQPVTLAPHSAVYFDKA